jgi:hypothetical protein
LFKKIFKNLWQNKIAAIIEFKSEGSKRGLVGHHEEHGF